MNGCIPFQQIGANGILSDIKCRGKMTDYLRYRREYENLFNVIFAEDDQEFPRWLAGKAAGYEVMLWRQQSNLAHLREALDEIISKCDGSEDAFEDDLFKWIDSIQSIAVSSLE